MYGTFSLFFLLAQAILSYLLLIPSKHYFLCFFYNQSNCLILNPGGEAVKYFIYF